MKSQAPLTALGMVMGSPSYIAPEAWRGDSKLVDHRADLYSLTVVAFRMLTGRVPFHSETLLEQLSLVTTAERPSLHALRPDLPRDIDDWVTQALAVRPDYRFNTARAWYSALVQVLSEGDVPAGTIEPERPETTPVERRNAVVAAFDAASSLLRRLAGQAPASLDRPVEAPPSAGSDVPLALSPVAPLEGDSDRDPATESSVPWTSLASSTWRVSAGEEEHPEDGDRRSFVSEWLSGSALDPEALARATDADVIDWLRGDTSPEATPSSDAASSGIRAFGERLAETVAAEHTRGDSGREGEAAPPAAAAPPSTADSGGVRHPVSKKNEATPKKKQKTENQKQPAAKQPGTRKRAGTRKQPAAKKKPAVKKQPAKQKPPVSPQKRAARGKAASKKRRRH
jgi:serine/threonine-protein kinase